MYYAQYWAPNLMPVSYTHLDVYKRQIFKRSQRGIIQWVGPEVEFIIEYVVTHIGVIMTSIYPVSYTHLDVYKRQVVGR